MKPIDPEVRLAGPALTVDCMRSMNAILEPQAVTWQMLCRTGQRSTLRYNGTSTHSFAKEYDHDISPNYPARPAYAEGQ